jgi:hypothetical protein
MRCKRFRFGWPRRQVALREKQEAIDKVRRLDQGGFTIDDLISAQVTCEQLCSIGSTALGPASSAADLASLVDVVSALAAQMLDMIAAATLRLADVSEQTGHAG